jgi:drug/metabolite transporter (DMT)-like permease
MNKKIGYIYLILTFFIWGSLYIAAKYAMNAVTPLFLLMTRYGLSVIVLYFVMKKRGFKKVEQKHRKIFFAIGAVGYFGAIAFQLAGTNMLDASLASLINSLNPVVIPIIAAVFLKEKINLRTAVSIILSLIGVYIILGIGGCENISPWGIAVNVLSLLFWSASCCMVRGISADYDPIQITFYAMAIAFVFSIPAAGVSVYFSPCRFTPGSIAAILYIAFICTALSHVLWNKSLSLLDASTCSLFYPLQPLTSAVLGILLLGEKLSISFIIGAAIICAGILLAVAAPRKRK